MEWNLDEHFTPTTLWPLQIKPVGNPVEGLQALGRIGQAYTSNRLAEVYSTGSCIPDDDLQL